MRYVIIKMIFFHHDITKIRKIVSPVVDVVGVVDVVDDVGVVDVVGVVGVVGGLVDVKFVVVAEIIIKI